MIVPIRVNGAPNEAEIHFVTKPEFGFLGRWQACLKNDKHPIRTDAVVFAALACKRFSAHSSLENYAQRIEDIADHIRDNPNSEVANFVLKIGRASCWARV